MEAKIHKWNGNKCVRNWCTVVRGQLTQSSIKPYPQKWTDTQIEGNPIDLSGYELDVEAATWRIVRLQTKTKHPPTLISFHRLFQPGCHFILMYSIRFDNQTFTWLFTLALKYIPSNFKKAEGVHIIMFSLVHLSSLRPLTDWYFGSNIASPTPSPCSVGTSLIS